ncbi:hypothetical protein NDU88_004242 [Pleurodeles waltl]|uniref:Uncharacterized protein n=1 Tax=Pleurodeles waltl TaxID=8319 RepID=A0AAV7PG33_PLEWA|nr:hypothetical protein NDU88_004242 [Pleurodeles waltl]
MVFTFAVDQELSEVLQRSSSTPDCSPGIQSSNTERDELKPKGVLVACASKAMYLSEDLTCTVCQQLFQDPVLLKCGHNFCQTCIDGVCVGRVLGSCPLCRAYFCRGDYTPIMALARLVERMKESYQVKTSKKLCEDQLENKKIVCKTNGTLKAQCEDHQENMQFFCKDDGVLMCIICRDAPKHLGHKFLSIQNAVSMYKDQLSSALDQLASARKKFDKQQADQEKSWRLHEWKANDSETSISSLFKKFHQPIENQKLATLNKLAFQGKVAQKKMADNLTKLQEDVKKVKDTLDAVKMRLKEQDPLEFLNGIQSCLKRCSKLKKVNSAVVSTDLHKHAPRCPTALSLWKKLKTTICSTPSCLTLDHDTAHCELVLSEDRTSVWYSGTKQTLPDHPKRFTKTPAVLALQGFWSGTHYWEVHVGTAPTWAVGVALDSISRTENIPRIAWKGLWLLQLKQGNVYEALGVKNHILSLASRPQKIGVYLDTKKRQVSFFNADGMCHIHTFHCVSSSKVVPTFLPYFSPCTGTASKHSELLTICY